MLVKIMIYFCEQWVVLFVAHPKQWWKACYHSVVTSPVNALAIIAFDDFWMFYINKVWLFQKYLSNRKQRVVLNGSYADYLSIESGVPQGSVLDPLLFLVYINDLERNIKSNIKLFDDDTMLFSIVKNPEMSRPWCDSSVGTSMKIRI